MTTTTTDYAWLDDPAEREWLINVEPLKVLKNAHRMYDFMRETGMAPDSYTRELAFEKAAAALDVDYDVLYDAWLHEQPAKPPTPCVCAHNNDGSVTTMLCSLHASQDPCLTMAQVTGKRRKGSIVRGTCTACGWTTQKEG